MNLIETLENLEPVFVQAAQLALKMQKGAVHHNKYSTGNSLVDIVTEADLAVQEFLLAEIIKTPLADCRLLAEENTPLAKKFNEDGKYYLGIDPIDGTATYAKGGKVFSTIISLHDGENILYIFVYYPVLNLTIKVVNNKLSINGDMPTFSLPYNAKNTIAYWASDEPERTLPEIYKKLLKDGFVFQKVLDLAPEIDTITILAGGMVAGTYNEKINVYDGLVELSIAQAKGLKIYSGGPHGKLDLSQIIKKESGLYYPGYYLVLDSKF